MNNLGLIKQDESVAFFLVFHLPVPKIIPKEKGDYITVDCYLI